MKENSKAKPVIGKFLGSTTKIAIIVLLVFLSPSVNAYSQLLSNSTLVQRVFQDVLDGFPKLNVTNTCYNSLVDLLKRPKDLIACKNKSFLIQ